MVELPLPPDPPAEQAPRQGAARDSPSTSATSSSSSSPEPVVDDGGYKFKPGQRVEVLRSDNASSPGTIVGPGWEGVFDVMYKVMLDNGLCKEAVPEEEISAETCDVGSLFDDF